MSIARYWISPNGIACEDNEGKFVRYEDHAAIEARCAALAAENAGLKDAFGPGDAVLNFLTIALRHTTHDQIDLDDVTLAFKMSLPEAPATDAFLAEVRAQGVEMCSAEIQKQTWDEREGDGMVAAIDAMEIYAAQLRKGVQS